MRFKFEDTIIECAVHHSAKRKRTMALQVTPEGVRVRVPQGTSTRRLTEFVEGRAAWIVAKLGEQEELRLATRRLYESGASLKYLGADYRLTVRTVGKGPADVSLGPDGILATVRFGRSDEEQREHIKEALESWYRSRAHREITAAVERASLTTGLVPNLIRVKDLKRAWGICSPNNSISFNWRLVLAPVSIIDYIVVHELCHIVHKNHSREFYAAVAAFQPDYREHRRELRRLSRQLELL